MELIITQSEDDDRDYLELLCKFIDAKGIKSQEQLEFRFDCLLTEFASLCLGTYDAHKKHLTV
jgi:hypothetical protein